MEIYLAVNRQKDPELAFSRRLQDYIRKQGCGVRILKSYQDAYQNYHFEVPEAPGIILALGGDGTYLQCVNDLNLLGLSHPVPFRIIRCCLPQWKIAGLPIASRRLTMWLLDVRALHGW